jgi:hypothetical protein
MPANATGKLSEQGEIGFVIPFTFALRLPLGAF